MAFFVVYTARDLISWNGGGGAAAAVNLENLFGLSAYNPGRGTWHTSNLDFPYNLICLICLDQIGYLIYIDFFISFLGIIERW